GADQTFQTEVGLKAGEQYISLALNFDDFRIVKKYKVLRPDKTEKFKVFITKNEVAAAASPIPPPFVPEPASVPGKATVIPEKANIVAAIAVPETAQNPPLPQPTAGTASITPTTVTTTGTVPPTIVVTTTLPTPTYYEKQAIEPEPAEYAPPPPPPKPKPMKIKPQVRPRQKPARRVVVKSAAGRISVPVKPQSKPLLIRQAVKPPAKGQPGQYKYVWEFSRGKLMALKEAKGRYSAEIYIPAKNQWLSLKELSETELQTLIEEKPGNFKSKGK
ncbi:MAG TPA: hypothetical protein VMT55_04505, partial [Candidatus Sulfotelmatobacter sp.]|nr:hypothetical protein [Candidatus Sulfotelmatobacter sp.]